MKKRFKTKQEAKEFKKDMVNLYKWMDLHNLWGLPKKYDPDGPNHTSDIAFTTDPHPFDNLDLKIRVTPKQSKKLQKKAFKMGYKWIDGKIVQLTESQFLFLYKYKTITRSEDERHFNNHEAIELTYRQFLNGTVPKKEDKPLIFKGREVKIRHDLSHARYFNCGYVNNVYASSIVELLDLKKQLNGQVSLDELADFAEANRTKLGL
jgi:hypothetical protein